ncbi:MMPL family transporter [Streptomyces radiopugnans]|uniref:MMPL family transporter n=1 Tax=Streptomyces radiopugnans TaxID=403935 RepID=UPI003F1AF711
MTADGHGWARTRGRRSPPRVLARVQGAGAAICARQGLGHGHRPGGVATVLAALATSQLSLLKLLGAGPALAVIVDATLVRGVLVPAAMKLLGRANRWAPRPLRRLHEKAGLRDT